MFAPSAANSLPDQREVELDDRSSLSRCQFVPTTGRSAESIVRDALRHQVLAATYGAMDTVDEFWVPRSNERADLAVIGRRMDGFEIKTERDSLRRLPRQIVAYGRLFDRCTVVLAERHRDDATQLLPEWWGITTVRVESAVVFSTIRAARTNPGIDPEILVRLLWRDEVMSALRALGHEPDAGSPRASLWRALLHATNLVQLRRFVRLAVLRRDPSQARIATRRFSSPQVAVAEVGP